MCVPLAPPLAPAAMPDSEVHRDWQCPGTPSPQAQAYPTGTSEPTIDEATANELGRPDEATDEEEDTDTDEDDADEAGNGTGEEETRPS